MQEDDEPSVDFDQVDWARPEVTLRDLGPTEELMPGVKLPVSLLLVIRLPDLPQMDLRVRVTYDEQDRVFDIREVTISTPKGAPEILRTIPLRSVVQEALFVAFVMMTRAPATIDRWRDLPPDDLYTAYIHPSRSMSVLGRRQLQPGGPTDENLKIIAEAYRFFRLVGVPPTKFLQEMYSLARSTATRWIASARQKGFLDQDEVGRGGGAQSRYKSGRV